MEDLHLRVGECITLPLRGLGSAGYRWSAVIEEGGTGVRVFLEAGPGPAPAPPSGLPPDTFDCPVICRVCGRAAGRARVRLVLARAWEADRPPVEELLLVVIVQ